MAVGPEDPSSRETRNPRHQSRACEGDPRKATDISIFPVNPVPGYKASRFVNNQPTQFVLDTGAAVTLLQRGIWEQMKLNKATLEPWNGQRLVGVEGTPLQVCGTVQVELRVGEETFKTRGCGCRWPNC